MKAILAAAVVVGCSASCLAGDEPRAIVDKAIAALGGAEKLAKMQQQSWSAKGTMSAGGQESKYTCEYLFGTPDKFRFDLQMELGPQKMTLIGSTDGKASWEQLNTDRRDMAPGKAEEFRHNVYVMRLSQVICLRDKEFALTSAGERKHGDRMLVGVKVSRPGNRDVTLYFDPKTHLPVMSSTIIKDENQAGKEVVQEVVFDKFIDVDGMKALTKLTILRDGKPMIVEEYSNWKATERLDPTRFAKPAN